MAAASLCAASSSHAPLIHQFDLNGSLADSVGATSLTALGGALGANEYVFGPNQGLTLDTKLGGVYSIDMLFRFDALYSYNRIIDFGANVATFFRDKGGEAAAGAVDFICVYDHTLNGAEVRALMPAQVSEPASCGLMGA